MKKKKIGFLSLVVFELLGSVFIIVEFEGVNQPMKRNLNRCHLWETYRIEESVTAGRIMSGLFLVIRSSRDYYFLFEELLITRNITAV